MLLKLGCLHLVHSSHRRRTLSARAFAETLETHIQLELSKLPSPPLPTPCSILTDTPDMIGLSQTMKNLHVRIYFNPLYDLTIRGTDNSRLFRNWAPHPESVWNALPVSLKISSLNNVAPNPKLTFTLTGYFMECQGVYRFIPQESQVGHTITASKETEEEEENIHSVGIDVTLDPLLERLFDWLKEEQILRKDVFVQVFSLAQFRKLLNHLEWLASLKLVVEETAKEKL